MFEQGNQRRKKKNESSKFQVSDKGFRHRNRRNRGDGVRKAHSKRFILFNVEIRRKVFEMILSENEKSNQEYLELIEKINSFNLKTKSYRPKKRNQRRKDEMANEEQKECIN